MTRHPAGRPATKPSARSPGRPSRPKIDAALDKLYKGTKLEDEKLRLELLEKGTPAKLKASKDPFIKLAVALWPTLKKIEDTDDGRYGSKLTLTPKYATARSRVCAEIAITWSACLIAYGIVARA